MRTLDSGSVLCQLAVRVPGSANGPATSVPVTVWDPPTWCDELEPGAGVVVLGRVKRRFWQGATGASSRVEVEAERIVRPTDRRALAGLARRLGAVVDSLAP